MAAASSSTRFSSAMERTNQWVFSQEVPTDIIVEIGEAKFPLHKFMLVSKSGYVRRRVLECERSDLARVDLSGVPGGAETFEKAAKFCYGVNFEISVNNIATLRCAAEYLEMTDKYYEGNLAGRSEEFLAQVALKTLPGAVLVLKSCESLLPMAEDIGLVQRCVDVIALKACNESNFPTRSPAEWWATELAPLSPNSLRKVLAAMKSRGASPKTLATTVSAYAEKSLPVLLSLPTNSPTSASGDAFSHQRALLESLTALLPPDRDAPLPAGFLCCLLRAANSLSASIACRRELERRVAGALDRASSGDLLAVALDHAGDRIADLDSVRRIIAYFVEKESAAAGGGGLLYGGVSNSCSAAMQKVARTLDAFAAEIATDEDLPVSKFAAIHGALPKSARRLDDDLYRAVDIYLKAHPGLDEIEREKVCSVMDPLRLSYEARLHASQNKRLPLQIVLHALYYDQLKLRSGSFPAGDDPLVAVKRQVSAAGDAELARENAALRTELAKMRMYVTDMQKGQGSACSGSAGKGTGVKKGGTFFSSVTRTLGKLNPFKQGSKDTSHIDDGLSEVVPKQPRRRRFSIS
ncbi:Root phototropism protein 2 [Dioscorea alata]|uniref:Root phototropism protein 2 n=1 Tax=Dioscorea alata TaxID=55571 RepID=A0ACB7U1D5_DIOAL|nr:Root phototropism protein 2 [Dioscorea alata]